MSNERSVRFGMVLAAVWGAIWVALGVITLIGFFSLANRDASGPHGQLLLWGLVLPPLAVPLVVTGAIGATSQRAPSDPRPSSMRVLGVVLTCFGGAVSTTTGVATLIAWASSAVGWFEATAIAAAQVLAVGIVLIAVSRRPTSDP